MRKALIGLIMAATVMTPVAAQAQRRGGEENPRAEQNDEDRQVLRQAREERQEQRQERRQERREEREPAQVRVQQEQVQHQHQQAQPAHQGRERESRFGTLPSTQGWAGPRTERTREHQERYDRLARENALRYGTDRQVREVRREHRDVHQDYRRDHRDLHASDPTRREHRRFHNQVNRDHGNYHGDWNRGWRNDRRYDWQRWRYSNRDVFRGYPYYAPYRNHRYSRFSVGVYLGSPFYDQRYWIGDPWQYRLPAAPYGTQWVRYYGDVLLVDVYTGQVIDVIYDFFW